VDDWIEKQKNLIPELTKTPPENKRKKHRAVAMY